MRIADRYLTDRYLRRRGRVVDLATGARVRIRRRAGGAGPAPFSLERGWLLIDAAPRPDGRVEVWERMQAGKTATDAGIERTFVEALDSASYGTPRLMSLPAASNERQGLLRRLAYAACVRGWLPIAASHLGLLGARRLASRSLVLFVDEALAPDAEPLRELMAAARPCLLVGWPRPASEREPGETVWRRPALARDGGTPFHRSLSAEAVPAAIDEAGARWPVVLAGADCGPPLVGAAELRLARVLLRAGRAFEARGLLTGRARAPHVDDERTLLLDEAEALSRHAAAATLRTQTGLREPTTAGRDGMVDDFVGVLQLCQDVEDERVALARVGAYLRERLQAVSVAFVVREGPGARAIASAGLDQSCLDAALAAIESGCSVPATAAGGPAESAAPVRYAADVIGALWVRWPAGMAVSGPDASALLGVAAVAAAPSLRGVLDRERPARGAAVPELIGDSPAMQAVREAVVRAARSPFPVLIEGESGVGKELVARAIHARGVHCARGFSAINCAALVDDLVEAELFGHARGAFTSAHVDRPGLFEEASGGTLFLDEVAELGSRVQAKLLRVLQEGEVRRIGETHVRRVDVRIVAATNRPLATEVNAGRFRRDLWYRLDVVRIAIPPLRERLEDLPMLVRHAWRDLSARTGSKATLSASAVAVLGGYDWPGNVRELQNVLASVLVAAPPRGMLGPSQLPAHVVRAAALMPASTLEAARRQFETRFIRAALARANGRTAIAARELGLTRQGLAKIVARLGLAVAERPAGPHVE